MKFLLIAFLLISPSVVTWVWRGGEPSVPVEEKVHGIKDPLATTSAVTLPVEVVEKGAEPTWVYVEVTPQAVPEPSSLVLLVWPAMGLLLHRRRSTGGDSDARGS